MSKQYSLCICVGIAELTNNIVYNSQIVVDKGKYLGLQRKINLSGDEYCYFGAGEKEILGGKTAQRKKEKIKRINFS
jgi:predicted amidohydrolase